MNDIITVKNVSKIYNISHEELRYKSFRDDITNLIKHPLRIFSEKKEKFYALKDITFSVKQGETLGIIGPNGAGKSTLLKILSRITSPSQGEITIRGRISSLLEVGTGFHPELTGRENIFLSGIIMGMKQREIKQKFDEIVDFAGIKNFLDTPVKHYSSGMYTRLAFSVAAHLEPEILIVDEVLAVGDLSFQEKSIEKINAISNSGKTVIFVSHNMDAISKICKKVLSLENGKIVELGYKDTVIQNYILKSSEISKSYTGSFDKKDYKNNLGYDRFRFKSVLVKPLRKNIKKIYFGEPFLVVIKGEAYQDVDKFTVGFGLTTATGIHLFNSYSVDSKLETKYKKGFIKFSVKINPNIFAPGIYHLDLAALGSGISEWIPEAITFKIIGVDLQAEHRLSQIGEIFYPFNWSIEKNNTLNKR